MPSPSATPTPITPPRVPLIDQRTGLIDRAWYMFFLSLFRAAQGAEDAQIAPNAAALVASLQAALDSVTQELQTQPVSVVEQTQPLLDAIAQRLDTLASSQTGELQQQINALRQEVETQPRPPLGSMAPLEQDNVPWLTFNTSPAPVPTAVGSMYWDGGTTMGVQMTANVLGRVNESEFVYVKASSAITKGQLCYHTGAVGASGVITVAPTPLNLADPNEIVGVAAEDIALNGFGLIQISGDLRGFNTTGSSVGETWADGDALYYNPAYVGSMTKVKPSAPNQKTYIGEVVNAAPAGSGSMHIRIVPGTVLGGTDSNVQITSVANKDILQYDSTLGYWKNIASTAAGVTSFSAGTTGLTPNTATTGAVVLAGTLDADNGGTGFSSYAVGDLLYANTTTTLAKLADVATGNSLISGGVGVAPSWGKIGLTTHVSGTLPVANGGTGLTSGTSGGVLYYSGINTLASSAALGANALVVGGGAGAAPSTIATGTGVVTALGVNTGSAGAFVVNGGALGTPSSGTVTNLTGTASININGTVGATTANTGNFTSLTSTSLSVETNGAINYFKASTGNAQIAFLPVYGVGNTNLVFSASGSSAQDAQISAGVGSASNLVFYTGGATLTERLRLDGSGNVSVGNAALATNATNGFLYVPTCAGTPTGTPTTITGRAPIVVDSTNNKLYFYSGGAWRDAGP